MRYRRMRIRGATGVGLLVLVGCLLAYFFWPDRSASGPDKEARRRLAALRTNPIPVARDLADGRVVEGDSVKDLIAKHEPSSLARHGRYTSMCFGEWPRVTVLAKDDRITWALYSGDENAHCFFCSWSEQEQNERQKSFESYCLSNYFEAVLGPAAVTREFPREWLWSGQLRRAGVVAER